MHTYTSTFTDPQICLSWENAEVNRCLNISESFPRLSFIPNSWTIFYPFQPFWSINLSLLFPFGHRMAQLEIRSYEHILVLGTYKKAAWSTSKPLQFWTQNVELNRPTKTFCCLILSVYLYRRPMEYAGHQVLLCSTTVAILLLKHKLHFRPHFLAAPLFRCSL